MVYYTWKYHVFICQKKSYFTNIKCVFFCSKFLLFISNKYFFHTHRHIRNSCSKVHLRINTLTLLGSIDHLINIFIFPFLIYLFIHFIYFNHLCFCHTTHFLKHMKKWCKFTKLTISYFIIIRCFSFTHIHYTLVAGILFTLILDR